MSGVKGIDLSSRGPMRVLSRGYMYQGIAVGDDLACPRDLLFLPVRGFPANSLSAGRPPWASGPAAAARPVEAGLGPARDGWPPTSALALLVKMAAVAIAATADGRSVSYSAPGVSVICRLLSHFAHGTRARRATRVAPRLREGMSLPRFAGPVARPTAPEAPPSVAGVLGPGRRGHGGSRDVRLRDRRLRHLGDCRGHLGLESAFLRLGAECQRLLLQHGCVTYI